MLRAGPRALYKPDVVNPTVPADTDEGDFDAALAAAAVTVDHIYTTPRPTTTRWSRTPRRAWDGATALTLYDSTQGAHPARDASPRCSGSSRSRCA